MKARDTRDTTASTLAPVEPEVETPGNQVKGEVINDATQSVSGALTNALKGLNLPSLPGVAAPVTARKASLSERGDVP